MPNVRLKRVLVTGAAQGIGLAIARAFAQKGAEVVLTDLNADSLGEAREALTATGALCRAYPLDVTDEAAVQNVRDQLHADAGSLDILVNNAGVVFGGAFLDVPMAKHQLTYGVNILGMVAMTHAFLPDLIASPGGHLVNVASASGFVGLPFGTTYASSKWAAIGFSDSIRQELRALGHKNVGVSTICPAYVATGLFNGAQPPKTTKFMPPEDLAGKVVAAVEKRRPWVLEPWLIKITPVLANILPTSVSDVLGDAFGASNSMKSWRGHEGAK